MKKLYLNKLILILGIILLDAIAFFGTYFLVGELKLENKKDVPYFLVASIFFAGFVFNQMYSFKPYLVWDEIKNIIKASFLSLVIVVIVSFTTKLYVSRYVVIVATVFFIAVSILFRYLYRVILNKKGLLKTNVVIIGNNEMGEMVERKVARNSFTTYNFLGYINLKTEENILNKSIGKIEDIKEILAKFAIDEAIIAIPKSGRDELLEIIENIEGKIKNIKFIPDMHGLITFSTDIHDIDGILAISTTNGLLSPFNRFLKSVFDYIFGVIGFIIFGLLYLVIGIMIRLEGKGPIIFSHKRVGKGLKEFKIYKFRTMILNAEEKLKEILNNDEKLNEEFHKNFKLKDDPRITKIGKFLRKTSLDEFPQFINIIKGEMSIVGPRPVLMKEIQQYYGEEIGKKVFSVKPGLTGMWQANGRSDIEDYDERIELDIYYIRNWSLWLDFVLIMKTIKMILNKTGAY